MSKTKDTLKWLWRITKENFGNKPDDSVKIEFDESNNLKVMSFNIRRDCEGDGSNNWKYRKDAIVEMIADVKPDIICMQEAMPHMAKYLKAKLSKYYDCCGVECFTNGELTKSWCVLGEGLLTFYRKDRFKLCSKEVIKLFDGRLINCRRAFITCIRDNYTNRSIDVVNTHFCHASDKARRDSFTKLLDWYVRSGQRYDTFFCGDFNCEFGDIESGIGKFKLIFSYSCDDRGTVNFFRGASGKNIDFIFSDKEIFESKVIREEFGGKKYLSDHWPILNTYKYE